MLVAARATITKRGESPRIKNPIFGARGHAMPGGPRSPTGWGDSIPIMWHQVVVSATCTVWLLVMLTLRKVAIPPTASPQPDWTYATVWTLYVLLACSILSLLDGTLGDSELLTPALISITPVCSSLSIVVSALYFGLVYSEDTRLAHKFRDTCPRYLAYQIAIHCFAPTGLALQLSKSQQHIAEDGGRHSALYLSLYVALQFAAFHARRWSAGCWPYEFMERFNVWHHILFPVAVWSVSWTIATCCSALSAWLSRLT